MSLFSIILDAYCGGLPRERRDFSEDEPEDEHDSDDGPVCGQCNTCGRTFHPATINFPCPRRDGGIIYPR